SFSFSGCSTGRLRLSAYIFTAGRLICLPLPAGLSGAVITATTLKLFSTNAFSEATAKSGVPINTILGNTLSNDIIERKSKRIFTFSQNIIGHCYGQEFYSVSDNTIKSKYKSRVSLEIVKAATI